MYEKIITKDGENYGQMGKFAFEYNNEKYYVGDIVNIDVVGVNRRRLIEERSGIFVMGNRGLQFSDESLRRRNLSKYKPYTDLRNNEQFCNFTIKLFNVNKRIE